jgi:4,5-dihydroxyphthalate decarboxylase
MNEVITVAVGNYDRTQPLITGAVAIPSVDLDIRPMTTGPMLASAARGEFDVTEHSLASYVASLNRPDRHYVAIPVFTSRMFRHNAVYVHRDAYFARPEDLIGGRIGMQAWHITAMVWIRGIFADEHGVALDSVSYVLGGLETPGAIGGAQVAPPAGVQIETAPDGRSLVDLLREREIDAIYAPGAPAAFSDHDSFVRRLLDDPERAERDYYQQTRLFPLMHVIVVRQSLLERRPELADQLVDGFTAAKHIAEHAVAETAEVHAMDPWLYAHSESTRRLMGEDFWPYGVDANRAELTTFVRYAHEQGLTDRRWAPEELFFHAPDAGSSD